jgi:hypothetical protein
MHNFDHSVLGRFIGASLKKKKVYFALLPFRIRGVSIFFYGEGMNVSYCYLKFLFVPLRKYYLHSWPRL